MTEKEIEQDSHSAAKNHSFDEIKEVIEFIKRVSSIIKE